MKKETGGPAFPAQHFDLTDAEHGMTMRDYFAAKAMQAEMAEFIRQDAFAWTAERAYKMADAMLKAREQ